jgi:hypothetical protein
LGETTIDNNRTLLGKSEIDIYVPDKKVGVEFHGLFWHNDLRRPPNYHLEKLDLATSKNIRLIQIFEDEWLHNRPIVESRLKYILGHTSKKIYARKCSIREVTSSESKNFLNQNHIQGHANASIKLGLYFENELMSIMTFALPNIAKGGKRIDGHWELLRFCNKIDTTIVGGANKLLAHFVKICEPEQIFSFADKRWSTGALYETIGFTKQTDTKVNYWYINMAETKRIHRFALRKNDKDDPKLTEYENRLAQGYLRIWDCGSSKWVWNNNSK